MDEVAKPLTATFSWAHASSLFLICFLTHNPERVVAKLHMLIGNKSYLGPTKTWGLEEKQPSLAGLAGAARAGLAAGQLPVLWQ